MQKLIEAIVAFEKSNRAWDDYMALFIVVARCFRQGVGLSGQEISDAITEALRQVRGVE